MGVPSPPRLGTGAHCQRVALTGLGLVTLAFGGSDWKTYGWTMAFLAAAVANLAFAYWELSIARSDAAEPKRNEAPSRRTR